MDVCQEVSEGLSILKDSKRVSGDRLQRILGVVVASLGGDQAAADELRKGEDKLVGLSLASLFTEACRQNGGAKAETRAILSVLEECDVDPKHRQLVTAAYESHDLRDQLHLRLEKLRLRRGTEATLPDLVDVDWRQELIVKSKNVQRVSDVNYLIQLKTRNEQDSLNFMSSLENLQDMVFKLRECGKTVEKTFQDK